MNAYLQIGSLLSILRENQIRTFFSDSTKQNREIRVLCIRVQKKSDSPSEKTLCYLQFSCPFAIFRPFLELTTLLSKRTPSEKRSHHPELGLLVRDFGFFKERKKKDFLL
jgi:hypothetical protein